MRLLVISAGLASHLFAAGQVLQDDSTSSQNAPPFKFESSVNAVPVPTLVLDAHGQTVGGMQQEDFQIFDKGKRQVITGVTVQMRASVSGQSASDKPGTTVSGGPAIPLDSSGSSVSHHYVGPFIRRSPHGAQGGKPGTREDAWRDKPGSCAIYIRPNQHRVHS
jgi:hypothetical protein